MDMNYFAILRYPNGEVDVRGPMAEGTEEEKVNAVYAHYLRSDQINKAPSIELVSSTAATKEEFMKEYLGEDSPEVLGR